MNTIREKLSANIWKKALAYKNWPTASPAIPLAARKKGKGITTRTKVLTKSTVTFSIVCRL
jgi:hypothetical protein